MYTVLIVLIILVCVLLTLVVLIQNPKGGGIASNFASTTQIMGVKKSSDIVEKATWLFAILLIVFTLSSNFFKSAPVAGGDTRLKENIQNILPGDNMNPEAPVNPEQNQQAAPETAPEAAPEGTLPQ